MSRDLKRSLASQPSGMALGLERNMIAWLQGILRLKSPSDQLVGIEQQEPSLEERLERLLGRWGITMSLQ
jgi:hypothetical protein